MIACEECGEEVEVFGKGWTCQMEQSWYGESVKVRSRWYCPDHDAEKYRVEEDE